MISLGAAVIIGFACVMLFIAATMALHAHSIDPPMENEEFLNEHPELRELKDDDE